MVAEEAAAEVVGEAEVEAEEEEESVDDRPLDEIFSLRPDMLTPPVTVQDEDEDVDEPKKKKKKKKKKFVKLEYDPDLNEMIVTKKHKRDDDDFENW